LNPDPKRGRFPGASGTGFGLKPAHNSTTASATGREQVDQEPRPDDISTAPTQINLRLRTAMGTTVRRLATGACARDIPDTEAEDSNGWNTHFDGV